MSNLEKLENRELPKETPETELLTNQLRFMVNYILVDKKRLAEAKRIDPEGYFKQIKIIDTKIGEIYNEFKDFISDSQNEKDLITK